MIPCGFWKQEAIQPPKPSEIVPEQVFTGDPFTVLAQCLAPYHPVKLPELPSGIGGLFGFWGYELINWIEPRVPVYTSDEKNLPDGFMDAGRSLISF